MTLTIHPLKLGVNDVEASYMAHEYKPGTTLPTCFTAFLILGGPEPIMVDTGIEPDFAAKYGIVLEAEHSLEANLARHGLELGDISTAIFTHLHHDHTGLADRLPKARFIMQRRELQYGLAPIPPEYIYNPADLAKFVGPLRERVELIDGDIEIADGIRTVLTGGHSPFHQMVYVDVPSGQAIITGDNVNMIDLNLTQGIPPGYVYHAGDQYEAAQRILRDAVHPLPSHDPLLYELYPNGVS